MEEIDSGLPPLMCDAFRKFNYTLTRSLYGITAPVIIVLTVINNVMVVVTLYSDKKKKRSYSCSQHSAIAFCNSLFGIVQLPVYFYFFNTDEFRITASHAWCGAYRILGHVIPHMVHTISIWQMVGLSTQRYLVFRYPFSSVSWYNDANMKKLTLIITVICLLVNINRFFDFQIVPRDNVNLNMTDNVTHLIFTCKARYRFDYGRDTYILFYHWFSAFVSHIIPCSILCILVVFLICAIYKNHSRRENLSHTSRLAQRIALRNTLKESSVLVLILLCLVVEIPSGIVRAKTVLQYHGAIGRGEELSLSDDFIITHFLILLSYYFYLYIYIAMNADFRRNFFLYFQKLRPERRHTAIELQDLGTAI